MHIKIVGVNKFNYVTGLSVRRYSQAFLMEFEKEEDFFFIITLTI